MKNVAGVMKYAEYEVRGYWKVGVYDYSLESK